MVADLVRGAPLDAALGLYDQVIFLGKNDLDIKLQCLGMQQHYLASSSFGVSC